MGNFDRLNYNPDTGVFNWVLPLNGRVKAGDLAGSIDGHGYLTIRYGKKLYNAHRIAWCITYGALPDGQIDHINGNPLDNRITNLRDVSCGVNQQNKRRPRSHNKSGFLGVCWSKAAGKWVAAIRTNGKSTHLGLFNNPAVAHEAYLTAKRKMHEGCTI